MKCFYLLCALLLTNSAYSMNDDDTVSIDLIVTNLNTAIENKDANNVAYWDRALQTLVSTDWDFFSHDQKSHYMQFHISLFEKTDLLNRNKRSMEEKTILSNSIPIDKDNIKAAIVALLIKKLEQNKYDINWTNLLGSNIETTHSPEELKQLRIKTLEESHIPKLMQ